VEADRGVVQDAVEEDGVGLLPNRRQHPMKVGQRLAGGDCVVHGLPDLVDGRVLHGQNASYSVTRSWASRTPPPTRVPEALALT
jgi:hypothetical protein